MAVYAPFFCLLLASIIFQKTYLATFLTFQSQKHATKELSQGRCVTSQKQQTSPEMLIYVYMKGDTNLTKEGSLLTTRFKL